MICYLDLLYHIMGLKAPRARYKQEEIQ